MSCFKFLKRYSLPTKTQLARTFKKKGISNASCSFELSDRWGLLAGCVRSQGYEEKGKKRRKLLGMSHLRCRPPTSPGARPPASSTIEPPTRTLVMHPAPLRCWVEVLSYQHAHYIILSIQAYRPGRRKYAYSQYILKSRDNRKIWNEASQ